MADARTEIANELDSTLNSGARREFLKLAAMGGLGVFMPAVIAACNNDTLDPTAKAGFSMGAPAGALNLIYAYTQFMADFYARVTANKYAGMTRYENYVFGELNTRATNVRSVFQNIVTAGRITDAVLFNFANVDFSSRASVVAFTIKFNDLGVAMCNGFAPYLKDANNTVLVNQVSSGFARGATFARDAFTDTAGVVDPLAVRSTVFGTIDANGLDQAVDPNAAIATMQPYFRTTLSASGV